MVAPAIYFAAQAAFWGYRAWRGYRAVRAAQVAAQGIRTAAQGVRAADVARAAQAAKALSQAAARDEACSDCDNGEDPCKHLRRGGGNGPYRGGAHGETRNPTGDGLDSHHIPAKDAYSGNINDMSAIQMLPEDHRKTMSNGNKGAAGARWRATQRSLIQQGRMREAIQMDIDDARRIAREAGDPTRYDEAIREMEAYQRCREQHGLDQQNPTTPEDGGGGTGNPGSGDVPTS